MGVYDEQLNLSESSDDGVFLKTIKKILRKTEYRYLKNFRQLFDNESGMKNMKRAIEKPSHGKISVFRTKCILDKLGLKYSIINDLKLTIYLPGEIIEAQEEIDVKSLYPSIEIPQETKLATRVLIENCNKLRNKNNKIRVYLPKELLEKNKSKEFKYFELYYTIWLESLCESQFKPQSGRIILITRTDEPGYSYKPINFSMYDLSDEEFNEFLKIFNLQGSCTSKISLSD